MNKNIRSHILVVLFFIFLQVIYIKIISFFQFLNINNTMYALIIGIKKELEKT